MQDMILTGGANVYPAEVEAALLEHTGVRSAVVIGLPDEDKGNRIHAIVDTGGAPLDEAELKTFLAERSSPTSCRGPSSTWTGSARRRRQGPPARSAPTGSTDLTHRQERATTVRP